MNRDYKLVGLLIVSIDSSKTPRNRYSRGFFKTYEY